jgi:hypothetical protein
MAGLTAARVLADAYDQVTVLERDALPAVAVHRKGVPQSHHAHALLAGGRVALEELFCGLTDELVANGALSGGPAEVRVYNDGLRLCLGPDDRQSIFLSRPLLEGCVRESSSAADEGAEASARSFHWSFRQARQHMTGLYHLGGLRDLTSHDGLPRDPMDGRGSTSNS